MVYLQERMATLFPRVVLMKQIAYSLPLLVLLVRVVQVVGAVVQVVGAVIQVVGAVIQVVGAVIQVVGGAVQVGGGVVRAGPAAVVVVMLLAVAMIRVHVPTLEHDLEPFHN
jgi:hypothetical protein